MPIYEYKCVEGHVFEVMQRISDGAVSQCETCGLPVERVFHPIAVHFKGSGFYNTDYGTRKRAREQKENGSSSASDSGSGKSESGSGKADSGSGKAESGSGTGKSESGTSKSGSGSGGSSSGSASS